MHRPLEHLAELVPRAGADLLDARAALAEHDRALAVALDVDDLLDAHAAVLALFPLLGLDRGLVGQLLVKLQEDLLARHLGRQQAQRQVGRLVLGIEERAHRQARGEGRQHIGDAVLLQRAHHEGVLERQQRVELGGQRQQLPRAAPGRSCSGSGSAAPCSPSAARRWRGFPGRCRARHRPSAPPRRHPRRPARRRRPWRARAGAWRRGRCPACRPARPARGRRPEGRSWRCRSRACAWSAPWARRC